jgi:ABC-type transporter Mla maintaining outer membrane lipid asymmetry ATPase subunit MlaF
MGFVFQQAALYDSLTVQENVDFPISRHAKLSPEERQNKVRELLSSVGLNEQDYGKMPSTISGGMQKRVGLARAGIRHVPIPAVCRPSNIQEDGKCRPYPQAARFTGAMNTCS